MHAAHWCSHGWAWVAGIFLETGGVRNYWGPSIRITDGWAHAHSTSARVGCMTCTHLMFFLQEQGGGGSILCMSLKVHHISFMNTSPKCVCPLQIVYAYLAEPAPLLCVCVCVAGIWHYIISTVLDISDLQDTVQLSSTWVYFLNISF